VKWAPFYSEAEISISTSRSRAIVSNFAGQWLFLRELRTTVARAETDISF